MYEKYDNFDGFKKIYFLYRNIYRYTDESFLQARGVSSTDTGAIYLDVWLGEIKNYFNNYYGKMGLEWTPPTTIDRENTAELAAAYLAIIDNNFGIVIDNQKYILLYCELEDLGWNDEEEGEE